MTIAEKLRRADIQLELLAGPLQGVYRNPSPVSVYRVLGVDD
ncbi:hypothetical protein [Spongiactinospora sp. TRM90649]|nr:hypothetical protein [Spongiactinospora sp. TRM90649]MDF5755210.1 hypothetical protein [Spongiactinospora sp. TRM90649]